MICIYDLFLLYDVDMTRRGFLKGMGAMAAHAAITSNKKSDKKSDEKKSSLIDKVREAHAVLKNKLVNNKVTQKIFPALEKIPDLPSRTNMKERVLKNADMTRRQFLQLGGSVGKNIIKDKIKDTLDKVKPYNALISPASSGSTLIKKTGKFKDNHVTKAAKKLGL